MRYQVEHHTTYLYDSPVSLSQQLLHMTPRNTEYQQPTCAKLVCTPVPAEQHARDDFFGNRLNFITLLSPHQSLTVHSSVEVSMRPRPTLQQHAASPAWSLARQALQHQPTLHLSAMPFLFSSPKVKCSESLAAFARPCFAPERPLLQAVMALTECIYTEFTFDPAATDIATPLDAVLQGKRGVCQDFAHLMIGALRSLGIAARYVSGYILTHPPAGQPRLVGADASHAWVSVYCPVNGWVDFDPTNNSLVQQEHITVAWGRDFSDVSPMRGVVLGGGQQSLKVSVTVTPLTE